MSPPPERDRIAREMHDVLAHRLSRAERPLAEAIAERTGLDPDRDLFPAVTAAAIASAIRVAGRHWLEPGNDLSFATALFRALSCVFQAGEPRE